MEKWQVLCIADLKSFKGKEASIARMEEELEAIESRCGGAAAVRYDKERTGGNSPHDLSDQWLNDLALKDELKRQLQTVRYEVAKVKHLLAMLTEDERSVLEGFYINRTYNVITKLTNQLHLEKSSVYRLKDEALRHYTLLAYGATSY